MSPSRRTRKPSAPALRRARKVAPLLCLALAASLAYLFAHAGSTAAARAAQSLRLSGARVEQSKQRPYVPGEIIVRFRGESKADAAEYALSELSVGGRARVPVRVERPRGFEVVRGLRLARVEAKDTEAALASLRARADVLYAEPNYVRRRLVAPNDTRYGEQWSLNTPPPPSGVRTDISAEAAWEMTKGDRSVVVGVVDEGVDISHPDLQANVWTNAGEVPGNGVDDDGDGYADDVHGWDFFHNDASVYDGHAAFPTDETDAHGTHVAGTVGAVGNNARGVAGVNWQVSLLPLKVLGRTDEDAAPSSVLVTVRAYAYAKAMRDLYVSSGGTRGANVRVLNNSYGGVGRSQAELDAIRALGDSGILFVAAAGNESSLNDTVPVYPANYEAPNLISVAATDQTGVLAGFSNTGRTTVHVSAPGVNVLSTTPGNTYAFADGTSMAAPHVAGAAALLCARRPDITVARMRSALLLTGEYTDFLNFNTVTGRRLNAAAALQSLDSSDATPPAAVTNLQAEASSLGREVRMSWNATGDDGVSGRATLYEIRFSENDLTNPAEWAKAYPLGAQRPADAFTPESLTFNAFYGHSAGYVGVRARDEVGNASPVAQVHLNFNELVVNPYALSESAAAPLSTGGTALGLVGDDKYKTFQLPFSFPFYGYNTNSVTVSTNGVIYPVPNLYPPPVASNGSGLDSYSSPGLLTGARMIAVAWDDLRTDRRAGDDVYVVQPDADRVIFRWQGVTFDTPFGHNVTRGEHPVSFEAELRRDGTVVTRYGAGNQQLFPVVGMSDGMRDAYVSASHTSEEAPKDLTNAGTVNFDRRKPDTSPSADLRLSIKTDAAAVASGGRVQYIITLINLGGIATNVTVTDDLPAGTKFVSCSVMPGNTCSGPASGTNGRVTFTFNNLSGGLTQNMSITAEVSAAPGSHVTNTATASGALRDPDASNNTASVAIDVLSSDVFMNARAISSREYYTLALKTDGTVWGWGDNRVGQIDASSDTGKILPVQIQGLSNVKAVAAGGAFALALKEDGTVWAWGDNARGELGNGDAPARARNAPVQVKGLDNITAIAAGATTGHALRGDGTLWSWGDNSGGQLGTGSTDIGQHFTPVHVMSGVSAVAAGNSQTYALKSDGTVWVCGYNNSGLAGQPAAVSFVGTPTQIAGLSGVRAVVSGANSAFAIKTDGTLWAWGDNSYGQLGNGGPSLGVNHAPAMVPGITDVVSVTAGHTYVFASKSDGTLWGWGQSQLPAVYNPTQVSNVSGVSAVTAGTTHAALLTSAGTVRSWGANGNGEIGDGTNSPRNVWVDVSGLSRVATPTLSPEFGMFWPAVDVTVNCPTQGAVMHYTVNSFNDPTEADPVIAPGTVLHLTTSPASRVRVRAWKDGSPTSLVVEGYYNIMPPIGPVLPNPIDNSSTFVERHYKDFLNRDGDPTGVGFWTNQIESCGASAQCREVKRINVSAAFFLSIEFQETGYFVYRLEKASFNRLPHFQQFMAETKQTADGVIVNTPGWEQKLEDGKRAFAELWVRRVDFKAAYDSKSDAAYVDALYANAGVTPDAAERDALVAGLAGQAETRASVLRKIADTSALKRQEYNRAFVLMQYFGYLRRDPDPVGYNFWLTKLDSFNGDWRGAEMVKAFITSDEYRHRFGP